MIIRAIYKPNVLGDYIIPPDELEKAHMTLIGKPVKLNFKETIGKVIDVQHFKNNELEITLELPELRGGYITSHIDNDKRVRDISFTELSMVIEESEKNRKKVS